MDITIHLTGPTVKPLTHLVQIAFRAGNLHSIKRITALVWLGHGQAVAQVAQRLAISKQTIYNWLHAFVLRRWASLRPPSSLAVRPS